MIVTQPKLFKSTLSLVSNFFWPRRKGMKFLAYGMICTIAVFGQIYLCRAETTLGKIERAGTLVIGTRTDSPPFAFVNKNNEWVGFSISLRKRSCRSFRKKLTNRSRSTE